MKPSRRDLFGWSAVAAAGVAWPSLLSASLRTDRPLRLGLMGCDTDGIGLATDALAADPTLELVALADEHGPRAERARAIFTHRLRRGGAHPRVLVPSSRLFIGEGAAAALCALGEVDAVLLAGVAARRPAHLAAAVAGGKHAYLLAPGAVDATGCGSLEQSAYRAERQGLALGAGLHWRHDERYLDALALVRAGHIGPLRSAESVWRRGAWRRYDATAMPEANWYYDEQLSGGFLLAECMQSIDLANWFLGGHPESASGGAIRDGRNPGDLASHYNVRYAYPRGVSFSLHSSLEPFAPTERRQRLEGSTGGVELKHPQRQARTPRREPRVEAVSEFLAALRPGARATGEGACRANFAALIAATRTAILGREAAQAGGSMLWSDVA